jgi:hypothetical protein
VSADKTETVQMPDLWQSIRSRMGLKDAGRFYFEAPLRWTKTGALVVEVTGNTLPNSDTGEIDETWYRPRHRQSANG